MGVDSFVMDWHNALHMDSGKLDVNGPQHLQFLAPIY